MHATPYKKEEVIYPELKIESFVVDKLITYFDQFDASITNGLMVDNAKDAENTVVKVRQYRLNHKPFSIHLTVNSEKKMPAVVRVFVGPKYDPFRKPIEFYRAAKYFYELDNFIVDLSQGPNKIVRNSQECFLTMPDPEPSEIFYKRIVKSLDSGEQFSYPPRVYSFPERLILPRGKKEGFPLQMFVHVSPVDDKVHDYQSRVFGEYRFDARRFGYPLDKRVEGYVFEGPNMMLKDVLIFHKDEIDVNIAG